MKEAKIILLTTIGCVGFFGDMMIGIFVGVCVLLFVVLVGGHAPRVKHNRYEYEEPKRKPAKGDTEPRDPHA